MIFKGKNIVITHALFEKVTEEMLKAFEIYNYTIFLDEVHEVIKKLNLPEHDRELLIKNNKIKVKEDGSIEWVSVDDYDTRFSDVRNLCRLGCVYYFAGDLYFYCFPISVFSRAKEVYVLTYLFEGQIQCAYYRMNGIVFKYKDVELLGKSYKLKDINLEERVKEVQQYKKLIKLYESSKINFSKSGGFYLTTTWFNDKENKNKLIVVKNALTNYFTNIVKGKSKENMWTTLEDYEKYLKNKGYTKSFVSLNARATNIYRDRKNLAYVYNRYINPLFVNFIKSKNGYLNEDIYGLSELLQWIFRSRLRDKLEVNLYLPAERMRELFDAWECLVNYNLKEENYTVEIINRAKELMKSRKDKINESKF